MTTSDSHSRSRTPPHPSSSSSSSSLIAVARISSILILILASACGSSLPRDTEIPDDETEETTVVDAPVVREVVVDDPVEDPEPEPGRVGTTAAPVPTGPPSEWRPVAMPPTVDRQVRAQLSKIRAAPFRVVRWMVFDHADGRGSAYVVYELTRHDACNALARATRTSKTPSEARARFENECTAQTTVPMTECKYVGLARFAIQGMPPPGVAEGVARVEMARDEVLDPELCSLSFRTFALQELDGDPDREILVDFDWQDLVRMDGTPAAPTKKVHALLVFRSDLSLQESRQVGTEFFETGEPMPEAPPRGEFRFDDVNRDGHADLVLDKENVEHCSGCRSTREHMVLRYDAAHDEWR